jgi:superfamily II DNA or RNA helicase
LLPTDGGSGAITCRRPPVERAVRQLPVRRWLGLTATPYRSDGLEAIILMQCGPVRHRMQSSGRETIPGQSMRREVFVHPTRFAYDGDADLSAPGAIQDVYRALVQDEERNTAIVADISAALRRDRHCLVLTNRRAHLDLLADRLRADGHAPALLHGGLSAKARRQTIVSLAPAPAADRRSRWPPGRSLGKASTARRWTPSSLSSR